MPKPIHNDGAKWVIAAQNEECTNTFCLSSTSQIIPKDSLCVKHKGHGFGCEKCGAKYWADTDDIYRDLIEGGFKLSATDMSKLLTITSFAYKKGAPEQTKNLLVVDVRKTIRNPWPNKSLRAFDGRSDEIKKFISNCPKSATVINNIIFQMQWGRDVSVGCHGGKHRSVAIVELAAAKAETLGMKIQVVHRDLKVKT